MCSQPRTGKSYTAAEDKYIYKCVKESRTVCQGITKAAKKYGRTEKAVMFRYYNVLKKRASKYDIHSAGPVGNAIRAKARAKAKAKKAEIKDPFGEVTSKFSMSKHQKMLDMDVRFTLASLARDHNHITIEVKGKQITAVFK